MIYIQPMASDMVWAVALSPGHTRNFPGLEDTKGSNPEFAKKVVCCLQHISDLASRLVAKQIDKTFSAAISN